jgi:hypothetical protein
VRLEGLGQLKDPMTSSRIQSVAFRLVSIVPQPQVIMENTKYAKKLWSRKTYNPHFFFEKPAKEIPFQ